MNSACRVFVRAFVVAGQLGAYAQADDLGCPKFLPPIEENYLDSIQNEVKAAPHQTELLLDNVIVSSSPIIKVARLEIKPGAKLLLPDSSLFAVVLAKELVFSGTPSGFTLQIAGEGGHAANGFPGPSGQNGMCRPLRTQAIIFSFGSAFGQNSFPMGWLLCKHAVSVVEMEEMRRRQMAHPVSVEMAPGVRQFSFLLMKITVIGWQRHMS